eukprot:1098432-Pleurochrysis_carterae.AAC.1
MPTHTPFERCIRQLLFRCVGYASPKVGRSSALCSSRTIHADVRTETDDRRALATHVHVLARRTPTRTSTRTSTRARTRRCLTRAQPLNHALPRCSPEHAHQR